ncbi:MAG: hypothetical protein R3F11_23115 [Verrucomicrobiales bacterium]
MPLTPARADRCGHRFEYRRTAHDQAEREVRTLRLSAGALNLTGDLQVAGDLVIAGGSVALNGHTLAVGRNFRLDANVMIDLGGGASLDVGGNAYLANGTLDLDGGALAVGGDLRVEIVSEAVQGTLAFAAGLGFFRMDGAGDTALVGGDFRMDSQSSHAGLLSGKPRGSKAISREQHGELRLARNRTSARLARMSPSCPAPCTRRCGELWRSGGFAFPHAGCLRNPSDRAAAVADGGHIGHERNSLPS